MSVTAILKESLGQALNDGFDLLRGGGCGAHAAEDAHRQEPEGRLLILLARLAASVGTGPQEGGLSQPAAPTAGQSVPGVLMTNRV